jgi:predicted AAA+ superfamily ATPase
MEAVTLLPLSRAELGRRKSSFLDAVFAGRVPAAASARTGEDLIEVVVAGGYPEMLTRATAVRRAGWAREYTRAVIARDVRDIAEVTHLDEMPRLMRALAQQAGQLLNATELGGQLGLDAKTVRRYLGILEQVYLVRRVEPWFTNRLKRLIKTPKLHFLDSGLLAALRGSSAQTLQADRTGFGSLLETFAYAEVAKQISWSDEELVLHHYRDKDQYEVDLVVERGDGAMIGLEIKAAATVAATDFAGMRRLAAACGDRFAFGAVLYDGDLTVPFGSRMQAVPFGALWR